MPNWSSTEIEITGDRRKIAKIVSRFKKHGLNQFPCKEPTKDILYDNYTDHTGKNHTGNWYNWRLANWGTKWNIDRNNCHIKYDENSKNRMQTAVFEFDSAWTGPNIWFRRLCEKYQLSGEYFDAESGCDFSQLIKYEDGELVDDYIDDYISPMSFERLGGMEYLLDTFDYVLENYQDEHWMQLVKHNINMFKKFRNYGSRRPIYDYLKYMFIDLGYKKCKLRDTWKEYKDTSWNQN